MDKKPSAIDLFAGAGGFSLAALKQNFELLAAVEYDQQAAQTYFKNIVELRGAEAQVFAQDINDVNITGFMKYRNIKPGELDLLLGGPPCQGFSTHRINDSGKDDPRNKLLLRYFDFVSALLPKAFLIENVPGLLWKRHKKYLDKFLELTQLYDYKVIGGGPKIINARDYGVPQNRKRAFILAVRQDLDIDNLTWPPTPTHYSPSIKKQNWTTASSVFERPNKLVLEQLVDQYQELFNYSYEEARSFVQCLQFGSKLNSNDPCNKHMRHSHSVTSRFEQTPLNGSRSDIEFRLKCHSNGYKGHKDVYGRILFHTPSNTITTGCNNPSKGRFVHPWLNHGITIRHAARLQSFPDDFLFLGSTSEQARQIGNAVPPQLGESLIEAIKNKLLFS